MILYKYLTQEKAETLITHGISLTPAKYLNDPWEFFCHVSQFSEEELREQFEVFEADAALVRTGPPPVDTVAALPKERRFDIFLKHMKSDEYRRRAPYDLREMLSAEWGIVSLTEAPLCRLMWAHYAATHKGIIIGIEARDLERRHELTGRKTGLGWAVQVRYEIAMQEIDFAERGYAARALHIKHPDWAYEKEWRIIKRLKEGKPVERDSGPHYMLSVLPHHIKHIIFGIYTSPSLKDKLTDWLASDSSTELPLVQQARIDATNQRFYAE